MPSRTACAMSEPTLRGLGKALGARADQHEGQAEAVEIVEVVGDRIDDGAIDARLAQRAQVLRLAAVIPVGREDQQRGALLGRAVLRAAGDLGPERVGDIGDDEAEHAAAARAHADGQVVALVAGGLGGLEHPVAGFVVDVGRARQRARGGALATRRRVLPRR